jgi:hypothetical protein
MPDVSCGSAMAKIVGDEPVTERIIAEEVLKTLPAVDEEEEEEAVTT